MKKISKKVFIVLPLIAVATLSLLYINNVSALSNTDNDSSDNINKNTPSKHHDEENTTNHHNHYDWHKNRNHNESCEKL